MVKLTKDQILQKKITLNNGVKIPQFGLGTYLITDSKSIYNSVMCALQNGYRHIDTAEYYKNEEIIGNAIKDFLSENPEVTRQDLFITSKIWNDNHKYELAKDAFRDILRRLKLEYLDLCLIHWPTKQSFDCWKALEEFYQYGKIRVIGVSNFNSSQLKNFLKKVNIKPAINQIETHPGFNQTETVNYCHKNNIAIVSWRTMLGGRADEVPLLKQLATKYNVTSSHIALRWAWQLGQIVIPKSTTVERIISNPDIGGFQLTAEEMLKIQKLPQSALGPQSDDRKFWKGIMMD
ncbi:aldo/keto reductase [Spiroplasma endosymbiont of Polydrusus pterygomalis]|uniref:aldo/keto reductase n=1 Tax=Spiroplasma endosymbiont of Polydrusus pterygomalis TaxID=3139327 RepID=UPI003CCAFDAF